MPTGSDMYRQQILDHYRNPRNYGELNNPTVTHTGENPMCGDEIRIEIELTPPEHTDSKDDIRIENIAFTGDGCAISQAAASLLTIELTDKPVTELVSMDRDDMIDLLGVNISPMRVKCAVLAEKVAQDAYKQYQANMQTDDEREG